MSKCQMNKYRAGGRCGGTSSTPSEGFKSEEYTAYLHRRQEQDRMFTAPIKPPCQSTAIVKVNATSDRKKDIDMILYGDCE